MQNVKNIGDVPYGNGVIFVAPGEVVAVDDATAAYLLSPASPVPFALDAPEAAAPLAQEPAKVATKPAGRR